MRKILFVALAIIGFAAVSVEAAFTQKKVHALAQSELLAKGKIQLKGMSIEQTRQVKDRAEIGAKDDDEENEDEDEDDTDYNSNDEGDEDEEEEEEEEEERAQIKNGGGRKLRGRKGR